MTLFEFILVMVTLILAIGVTQLLQGVAAIVHDRGELEIAWVPLVWAAYLFLLSAAHWWSLWDMRGANWNFPVFFLTLLAPTLLFLAVSLLVSGGLQTSSESMARGFLRIRAPFFTVLVVFSLLVTWDGAVLGVEPVWNSLRAFQVALLPLFVVGLASSRWRIQQVVAGTGPWLTRPGLLRASVSSRSVRSVLGRYQRKSRTIICHRGNRSGLCDPWSGRVHHGVTLALDPLGTEPLTWASNPGGL